MLKVYNNFLGDMKIKTNKKVFEMAKSTQLMEIKINMR